MLAAFVTIGLGGLAVAAPAKAGASDPLFINLTSDDGHRVNMALTFGEAQIKRGHALTVFLNDKAVVVASTANATRFADQQRSIAALLTAGATVLVCPMCMKHFGVKDSELVPGLKVGNPELTGNALFQDNTKTLTW